MLDSTTARVILELIAIVGLLSLNGLFALSEIAVVSANRTRLLQLSESNRRAKRVLQLADDPTSFLSTVQIGITLIGILAGALSGATLSSELSRFLSQVAWLSAYAEVTSFTVVVVFVTLLSLLIGELIPKSIALSNPERFAMVVAPLMNMLAKATAPIVSLLSLLTDATLRLLRIQPNEQPPITEDELKTLLAEGTRAGIFEPMEKQIVTQALELDDISLRPVLTHRTQVAWLDVNDSIDTWLRIIEENPFDAFPVCDASMDRTLGVVRSRELLLALITNEPHIAANGEVAIGIRQLKLTQNSQPSTDTALLRAHRFESELTMDSENQMDDFDIGRIIQPALFVPLTATPSSLLSHFRKAEVNIIFAVDEYGGVEGIVTQADVLAKLTDNIQIS